MLLLFNPATHTARTINSNFVDRTNSCCCGQSVLDPSKIFGNAAVRRSGCGIIVYREVNCGVGGLLYLLCIRVGCGTVQLPTTKGEIICIGRTILVDCNKSHSVVNDIESLLLR